MNLDIPGLQIKETLFKSEQTLIYRAVQEKNHTSVIVKTINHEYPSNQDVTRFKHEFYLTRKVSSKEVIQASEMVRYGNNFALILEDIQATSLNKYSFQAKTFDLKQCLQLALKISRGLSHIHQQNIIHKDINPSNILFNPETKQVQIIDFGIATELSREKQDINVTDQLKGSLSYISPEQTGRMNRDLDYRTDYYSLGVTLYEMLTGHLPFKAKDTIGWIYAHIAQTPVPPHKVEPSIPETVSNIVLRLMAKNAENCYQSASGIIWDLNKCLSQLEQTGQIENFDLGEEDVSEKFQIPQRLYGREEEVASLLSAFDKTAKGGLEYFLISGYAGVGKSLLVHEVHKPIAAQGGFFIEGKFDQLQKEIPYSAFVQAFQNIVRHLLSKQDESLVAWKKDLLIALGANGQIIIDLVPELEKIIGAQEPVQKLGPTEAQNRFLNTFKNFIQVFAKKKHPLVIFLDDLQWSDTPTLNLIEYFLDVPDLGYLFLIGSYRNNEVGAAHPLQNSLEKIGEKHPLHQLFLRPLIETDLAQLVSETLHCDVKTLASLTTLLFAKTQGNPFFINVLLKKLYQEGAFNFLADEGRWTWDLDQITRMEVTDNVVEFMVRQVKNLPSETQRVLQMAACIGNTFDLHTLDMINKQPIMATGKAFLPAIDEGIIVPLSDQYRLVHLQEQDHEKSDFGVSYKFQHDRVQQAAYSLLTEEKKASLHLKIARLLQRFTPEADFEEKLIDIVRHFNEGRGLIADEQEREKLSHLNLKMSKKAKHSNAYRSAFNYTRVAKELLPDNAWTTGYDHCFEVHREYAETAYLSREFEIAGEISRLLIDEAKTELEKAQVYHMQVRHLVISGENEEAILAGIQALSLLGIKISMKP
ncbi:MAG: serine/threonine-protein kinase PknK, partial [Proteobacteria bacterium]|nr:serine/threonine-protein kinase PknK [Pseudomonadota bacterium]